MASAGGGSKDTLFLNLNPMLDIFSILITFLLMSAYSGGSIGSSLAREHETLKKPMTMLLATSERKT